MSRKKLFKILLLSSPSSLKGVKSELLKEDNIKLDIARLSLISIVFDKKIDLKCEGKKINKYDYFWIQTIGETKDVAYMLSMYLDKEKKDHSKVDFNGSKIVDLYNLVFANVEIPKTYFCSNSRIEEKRKFILKKIGLPLIVKPSSGWGGKGLFLVSSKSDFTKVTKQLDTRKKYVFQKYIPNIFDYRIIVGNGKVLSGEKRIRKTDHFRNNVKLGAEEVFLDMNLIPDDVKELAIKATKACGLKWSGVDVVTDINTRKSYVLEVNRCPGITKNSPESDAVKSFMKNLQNAFGAKLKANLK